MGKTRREGLVHIERLTHEGRGVGRIDGRVVLVDFALPGETVRFLYTRQKGKWDEGVALALESPPSPDRVTPPCPHFTICGGCSLQHMRPDAQIALKQQAVLDQMHHVGHVAPEIVLSPLLSPRTTHYRHRARLGVNFVIKKDTLMVGFRERGGRYLQNIPGCQILHDRLMTVFPLLWETLNGLSIRSDVPQVEVLISDGDVGLCLRHLKPFSDADLASLQAFEMQTGFRFYAQPKGPETIHPLFYPTPDLFYTLENGRIRMAFEPTDFTQVNFALNQRMVTQALSFLSLAEGDRVLDLFCGLGNFTLPMGSRGAEVWGIEGDGVMVRKAQQNAVNNQLSDRVHFRAANLFEVSGQEDWLQKAQAGYFNQILCDPPRLGAKEILAALLPVFQAGFIERLVYISCHPATLARDAGFLVHQAGFVLEQAGVMDMFPHTQHVESIAVFTYLPPHKKGKKS